MKMEWSKAEVLPPVVILCGGYGKRLLPITAKIAKPMIPINSRPVLSFIIDNLKKQGFKNIILALHYLPEQFEELAKDRKVAHFIQPTDNGTAGALKTIENILKRFDHFLVVNGDTLTNLDYKKFFHIHKVMNSKVTVFTQDDDIHTGGSYIFDKRVLDYIPKREFFSIKDDLIPYLHKLDVPITLFFGDYYYLDIGTPKGLKKAKEEYAQGN